jgi:SAM-dependent methyltransferase
MIDRPDSVVEIRQLDSRLAPVNASLADNPNGGILVTRAAANRFGVAFQVPYYAGRACHIRISLDATTGMTFRLEAHGSVTRMQKSYLEIESSGHIITAGEELTSVNAVVASGTLTIDMTFVPRVNMFEWFYLFSGLTSTPSAAPLSETSFTVALLSARTETSPLSRLTHLVSVAMSASHGTNFDVSDLRIFRNYLHLDFEVWKPGAALTGLAIGSPRPLAVAQWWTHDGVAAPQSLPTPSRQATPPATAQQQIPPGFMACSPLKPQHALPSPAAMEKLGPSAAWRGHRITALYSDLTDFTALSVPETDAAATGLQLFVTFSDGTASILDVGSKGHFFAAMLEFEQAELLAFGRSLPPSPRPKLLEIGARGQRSAIRRDIYSPVFDYLAVDYVDGVNVDVVADAHTLSDHFQPSSVDVVTSESVMEHLLSPLRFVTEAARVLRPGGLFLGLVPTTFPLHAEPWDFWRISNHAWTGLLNEDTGFEILRTREFGSASIVPSLPLLSGVSRMQHDPAPLFTGAIARKIGEPKFERLARRISEMLGRYDH